MDSYLGLARKTITQYLKTGEILKPAADLPKELLAKKAGAFVSLHLKSDNSLRGCIGTYLPTKPSLAEEIINNAIGSATQDPRFPAVTDRELADLEIAVDILSEPIEVKDRAELDPKKYGVIVKSPNGRSGLLLPDLEGIDKVEEQLAIACQKAWIDPKEKYTIYKFTVERHKE